MVVTQLNSEAADEAALVDRLSETVNDVAKVFDSKEVSVADDVSEGLILEVTKSEAVLESVDVGAILSEEVEESVCDEDEISDDVIVGSAP